jgi:hypothetical protein
MYSAPVVPGNPIYETWIGAGCNAKISFLAPCRNHKHIFRMQIVMKYSKTPTNQYKDAHGQDKKILQFYTTSQH